MAIDCNLSFSHSNVRDGGVFKSFTLWSLFLYCSVFCFWQKAKMQLSFTFSLKTSCKRGPCFDKGLFLGEEHKHQGTRFRPQSLWWKRGFSVCVWLTAWLQQKQIFRNYYFGYWICVTVCLQGCNRLSTHVNDYLGPVYTTIVLDVKKMTNFCCGPAVCLHENINIWNRLRTLMSPKHHLYSRHVSCQHALPVKAMTSQPYFQHIFRATHGCEKNNKDITELCKHYTHVSLLSVVVTVVSLTITIISVTFRISLVFCSFCRI